ncbi:UNVERIFIED_CONTAM: Phospholipid-transporting ATPase ID [Trichonephila clavipes]
MPVLALGIFDQDVNDRYSLQYPKLYTPGHKNLLFNKMEFLKSLAHGVCTSFTLFFIPYGSFYNSVDRHGFNMDGHQLLGTIVSTLLVLVVTAQVALDTSYWTVFNHIVIFGSVAFFFALTLFINSDLIASKYIGVFRMTLSSPTFWITCLLVFAILLIPVISVRFYWVHVHPTLSDRVRLKQRRMRIQAEPSEPQIVLPQLMRRPSRRKSMRSGYAFAHQEGFGRLIMSGKIMKKSKSSSISNNMLPPLLPGTITNFRV